MLGTQIELHTYSNVLSVVRLCFISGGRESADAYLQLAYPPSRHIQIPTVEILPSVLSRTRGRATATEAVAEGVAWMGQGWQRRM
jgi:hypothetical protein